MLSDCGLAVLEANQNMKQARLSGLVVTHRVGSESQTHAQLSGQGCEQLQVAHCCAGNCLSVVLIGLRTTLGPK